MARFAGPTVALTVLLYAGYALLSPPEITLSEQDFEQQKQNRIEKNKLDLLRKKQAKRKREFNRFLKGEEVSQNVDDIFKIGLAQEEEKKRLGKGSQLKAKQTGNLKIALGQLKSQEDFGQGSGGDSVGADVASGDSDGVGVVDTGASSSDGGGADTTSGSDGEDSSSDSSSDSDSTGDEGDSTETSVSTTTGTSGTVGLPSSSSSSTATSDSSSSSTSGSSSSDGSSGGTGSTGGSSGDSGGPTVMANIGSGAFSDNPTVSLYSSEFGPIYYCVQNSNVTGTGCCDPRTSPTLYTAPFHVSEAGGPGTENGNICLQFYAQDLSGNNSELVAETYLIDSTNNPDLAVTQPLVQVQTNELGDIKSVDSTLFGAGGANMYLYELKVTTTTQNKTCAEVLSENPSPANDLGGTVVQHLSVDTVNGTPETYTLATSNLSYGDNTLVSLLENQNTFPFRYSCQTNYVKLFDFNIRSLGGGGNLIAPIVNGQHRFSGGFRSHGFFRAPADVTDMAKYDGEGDNNNNNIKLEDGFWNIVN